MIDPQRALPDPREKTPAFSPDQPEFRLLAQCAGVAPSRLAAAFNDPENFFSHVTIEEYARFTEGVERLMVLAFEMTAAQQIYIRHMTGPASKSRAKGD